MMDCLDYPDFQNQGNPVILSIKVKFVVMHAFELQALRAEVDEQTNFHIIRFEVIHGLGEMDVFQLNDGFEFDHDQFFDEEVYRDLTGFIRAVIDRVACGDGDSDGRAPRGNLSGLTRWTFMAAAMMRRVKSSCFIS